MESTVDPLRLQNARYLNFNNAATCSHSSGHKWPQGSVVAASGRKWPQVAASGRGCRSKWLQVVAKVAASGRKGSLEQVHVSKWPQVAQVVAGACWSKCPQVEQVAGSRSKWWQVVASSCSDCACQSGLLHPTTFGRKAMQGKS